jgi:tetratricopeptide (TPR) repeat protein
MDAKKQIRSSIQEAELYKSQGLFDEAKEKYLSIVEFIQENEKIQKKQHLIDSISKKISALEKEIEKIETAQISSEMSQKIQSFIKTILQEAEIYASQGLVAQAKEKYSQAAEFLKKDDQLKNKKKLLDGISKKISALEKKAKPEEEKKKPTPPEVPVKDEEAEVPIKDEEALEEEKKEEIEEEIQEFIDISSIGITLDHGPEKGRVVELDVSFQSGNMINLIISSKDKAMIENFKAGDKLNGIQFYSPIAIFKGSGIVSANTQIDSGPKQGDYRLEIKILST